MFKNHLKSFFLTFLALVAGFTVCSGNNGTSPQTGDGSVSEKSSLEKGMEPIFNLLHGFLDTVMPHNFYSQSDSPFSVQDLDYIIKNSDYAKLQDEWQDLFKTFGGFAACFILGLLFVIFFPIVTGCFCCCFCCCKNCGGKKGRYESKRAGCMRMTCTTLLLLFTTMMLAGGIITFLGAELFHKALKNENNEGVLGRVDSSLVTLQTFTANTMQELQSKTKEQVGNGLNSIKSEVEVRRNPVKIIEDTVHRTVTEVKNTINATSILDQSEYLGNATLQISDELTKIKGSLLELKELQTNVTTTLTSLKVDINATCDASCKSTTGISTDNLVFKPKFDELDELDSQATKINETLNIRKLISEAKSKFDNVSADVDKEVDTNVQTATTKTEEIRTQLFSELNKVDNATNPFNNSLEDGRKFISDNQKELGRVSDYIWYACIGLGCAILLAVFFYYMGVLFGICGERPGKSAACCNRGTGANLLYTGVFVSSVFSWLVMLLVAVTFLTGGLTYTLVCRYIGEGVENVGTFETVVQDSMGWNVSQALGVKDLSISGMFENCKENQAIYTALNFDSLFDIDKIVNVTDIENQVDDMTSHSFTLANITLMTDDLRTELTNFLNSGIDNITFSNYTRELNTTVIDEDLTKLAEDLDNAATTFNKPQLTTAAQDVRNLQDVQLKKVDEEKVKLRNSLTRLESHVDLTQQVTSLIDGIEHAQTRYNEEKDQIVRQSLSEATTNIKALITDTVNTAKNTVKNDIGKCRPLYDAAQGVADGVCHMGVDSFNSIWFGLGWAAFFYIPCFICAAVLAAHYMKIGSYLDNPKRDFDDPNHETYNGYMGGAQDNIPLTSHHMQDRINGKYNGAYDRNEGIDNQRDPQSSGYGYDPYQGHGSSYHDVGGYGSPQRPPPDYDDLTMQDYRGRAEGGYPKSYNY